MTGRVINSDGHGVAILESNGDLCVVRQEIVSAVRMPSVESGPHVPSQGPHQQTEFVDPQSLATGKTFTYYVKTEFDDEVPHTFSGQSNLAVVVIVIWHFVRSRAAA